MRSLATSFCTLLPVLALFLFGGETLRDFAFALLVGTLSGTYSSVFIAGPVLVHWKEREPVYRTRCRRIRDALGYVPAYAVATAGAPVDVEPGQTRRGSAGHRSAGPDPGLARRVRRPRAQPRDRGGTAGAQARGRCGRSPAGGRRARARGNGGKAPGARRPARSARAAAGSRRVREAQEAAQSPAREAPLMGALVWVMVGLAIWHFTIFLPDRFWAGIVGAFIGALVGSLLVGLAIHGFSVPGRNDTDLVTALEAIPGALLGIAAVYFYGAHQGNEPV